MLLVRTNISRVTIEALSHLENARGLSILAPEILWNLWNRVDPDAIEAVGVDQLLDPVLEIASDIVIFLVKIWETGKAAVLN